MRNKKRKADKSKTKITSWNILTIIAFLISVGWIGYQIIYQMPINEELAQLKHDFPMIQNMSEISGIAEEIPLPENADNISYRGYFPTVLLKTSQGNNTSFESSTYGYVLRMSTGTHTYLATELDQKSTEKKIVFTMGELRENRYKLIWTEYTGDFPPEGWSTMK